MPAWSGDALVAVADAPFDARDKGALRDLLIRCAKANASDIIFQTGQPVLASVYGHLFATTKRWLTQEEVHRVAVNLVSDESVVARLNAGAACDRSVQYPDGGELGPDGDPVTYRFRVNVTSMFYEGGNGIQIVLRYIKSEPPRPADIALEPEILREGAPPQGAVLIAGETGSGKTTTTAALKRNILEGGSDLRGNIICYEAPIEYLFSRIPSKCCTIAQHEVPTHVPSFAEGVRNAMRRNPTLIEIQELRDAETITAATEAAATGHTVYATTHANSVAHILRRLPQRFPAELQAPGFFDVVASTHLMVSQVLVARRGGGRVCLREFQLMTEDVRQEVEIAGPLGAFEKMQEIIQRGEGGRCMRETVAQHLEAGTITVETAAGALFRYGYRREGAAMIEGARRESEFEPGRGPAHGALTQ